MTGPNRPRWSDYTADPEHGPLPGLLIVLTAVTGLIDAVSILSLGRVFVANMTGNVAFVGFALARAPGFSLAASLSALAGFLAGALIGGNLIIKRSPHRGRLLGNATAIELVLFLISLIIVLSVRHPLAPGVRDGVAALTALALGLQNSAVRRMAVHDLTTTVLTMALTGIAADLRSGNRAALVRRSLAVLTMLVGALVGALLVLHAGVDWALAVPTVLIAAVSIAAARASRRPADWQHYR